MAKTPARHACPPNRRLAAQSGGPRWLDADQRFRSAKSTFSTVWRPPLGSPRRVLIRRESSSHRLHQRSQSMKLRRIEQERLRTRAVDVAILFGNLLETAVREHGGRKQLDWSVIHFAEAQLTPLVFFFFFFFFFLLRLARNCHAAPAMQGKKAFFSPAASKTPGCPLLDVLADTLRSIPLVSGLLPSVFG